MENQTDKILKHLIEVGPITPLEALNKFGCLRLGARIWDLKDKGHSIKTEIIKINDKHVAQYTYKEAQLRLFN